MTGFSIQQPWNELLVAGVKTIEVRRHRRKLTLPMTMAIHAGLQFDRHAPLPVCIEAAKWGAGMRTRRGAITGVATLIEIFGFTPTLWRDLHDEHRNPMAWYREGLWGWRFNMAVRLVEPVRCRGSLGFWSLPPDVEARLRRMVSDLKPAAPAGTDDREDAPGPEGQRTGEMPHSKGEGPETGRDDAP